MLFNSIIIQYLILVIQGIQIKEKGLFTNKKIYQEINSPETDTKNKMHKYHLLINDDIASISSLSAKGLILSFCFIILKLFKYASNSSSL